MAVIKVLLTDTIVTFVNKVNDVSEGLGDVTLLDTSGPDSDVVSSINSLDSDIKAIDSDVGDRYTLNYQESDGTFLTIVDHINRMIDSSGDFKLGLDSDLVTSEMLADLAVDSDKIDSAAINHDHLQDNIIDSNNMMDSVIYGSKFDAMTVLKIFASDSSELRKIYGPARFDKDSADTFKSNPWV